MHHCVRDFNPRGVSVENDATDLPLEDIEKVTVFTEFVWVSENRRSQMTLKSLRGLEHGFALLVTDNKGCGPENFPAQVRRFPEIVDVHFQESGGSGAGSWLRFSHCGLYSGSLGARFQLALKAGSNSCGEQMKSGTAPGEPTQFGQQWIGVLLLRNENETGFGAELSSAERERAVQAGGNLGSAIAESAGKDEDGIGAAHFREARDWIRALRGKVHKRAATCVRACEAGSFDLGMLDQDFARFDTRVEEQGKNARG